MASEGQLREFVGVLLSRTKVDENSSWSRIPTELMQMLLSNPNQLTESVVDFMAHGAPRIDGLPKPLLIDRSVPFNPAKFIGAGWTIWKGPKDGNGLEGEEKQDARSLALTKIELSKIRFEHCLRPDEKSITGEQKLARLRADEVKFIRPDAQFAQALFEEPGRRTLEWIRVNLKKTWFDFPGTELRSPDGDRCILCLYLDGDQWGWDCSHLANDWARQVSVARPCKFRTKRLEFRHFLPFALRA